MDISVMMLFFNRPEPLRQVFEAVRQARPSRLFLVQDGPRPDRPDDMEKVLACRAVVEQVDWPCQVFRNYSEENLGCDHREYTGISWCFAQTDRLIILEDDCAPTLSFFRLCEDLLERYRDDSRVYSISGFNRMGVYDSPYDYVFSKTNAGWGWATWKRVWDKVEAIRDLKFLDDEELVRCQLGHLDDGTRAIYGNGFEAAGRRWKRVTEETGKVPSWEYLVGMTMVMNDMLAVTPTRNVVKYLGISQDATHCMADAKLLPHKTRRMLTQPAWELNDPIRHPPLVLRDAEFERQERKSFRASPLAAHGEALWLKLRYGEFGLLKESLLRRLRGGK